MRFTFSIMTVRKVSTSGAITTLAGNGLGRFGGDGGHRYQRTLFSSLSCRD